MHDDREQRAEQWLDSALARYGEAEPRPGMEQRVLAGLSAQAALQPQHRWTCALAAAAAVVLLAVGLSFLFRAPRPEEPARAQMPQPALSPEIERVPEPEPAASAKLPVTGAPPRRSAVVRPPSSSQAVISAAAGAESRLEAFPSPQLATREERLLASYATRQPQRLLEAAQPLAPAEMEGLQLQQLTFEPIVMPGIGDAGETRTQ